MVQKHWLFPCKFADLLFADWGTKEICGFAICGLIITNLRICDLWINHYKFADLRFAEWHTKEGWICEFADWQYAVWIKVLGKVTGKKRIGLQSYT
jgi:hypothetical protein